MRFKFLLAIASYAYKNCRINQNYMINVLDRMDADNDGYITVPEIISYLRNGMVRR